MLTGIALGKAFPGLTDALRGLEFGAGSQINVPIAVLLWLMIYPMMPRIDLASVLVEVPVMLSVCAACNRTRHWFPTPSHRS